MAREKEKAVGIKGYMMEDLITKDKFRLKDKDKDKEKVEKAEVMLLDKMLVKAMARKEEAERLYGTTLGWGMMGIPQECGARGSVQPTPLTGPG